MGDYFKDIVLLALFVIGAIGWVIVRRKEIIASRPPKTLLPPE